MNLLNNAKAADSDATPANGKVPGLQNNISASTGYFSAAGKDGKDDNNLFYKSVLVEFFNFM